MARNDQLSDFWMLSQNPHQHLQRPLHDVPITIINNEDDFAHMIGHVVKSFGAKVRVVDTHTYVTAQDDAQVVIIGPGPGDPNDLQNPRIARLHEIVRALKSYSRSLLGVCLGHQVLAIQEGLAVAQQTVATQGMPRRVTIDGTAYQLGFYNSFSPVSTAEMPGHLSVSLDDEGRIIHMTDNRADKRMVAFQFHPESVMSKGGRELMLSALTKLTAIKG
jgi:phenazine biosynthesis protein phzE